MGNILLNLLWEEKWKPRSSKNLRHSATPRAYNFLKTSVSIFLSQSRSVIYIIALANLNDGTPRSMQTRKDSLLF